MIAFKPFWSVFIPEEGTGVDAPKIEVKARWLADSLELWSLYLDSDGQASTIERNPIGSGSGDEGHEAIRELRLMLDFLANAAGALLAFRRRDHPVGPPPSFLDVADRILARAEASGVSGTELTVRQVARRLSAARSRLDPPTRPVKIDEQGRVFDLSGRRLFHFNPAKILEGRRQIQAGNTHSLAELQEAERRDGR